MQHPHRCPECDGTIRETDTEHVCADCGLVVTDAPIDHGPEWRTFSDDPDHAPERTGAPLTRSRHDRGLSTEIGYSARLTGRKRRKFARLRRQHKRATIPSKADYNRIYGFTEIRRLIGTFGIGTGLRDQACTLFASAQTAGLLHGRTIEGSRPPASTPPVGPTGSPAPSTKSPPPPAPPAPSSPPPTTP